MFTTPYYWHWLGNTIICGALTYLVTSFMQVKGKWPLKLALINSSICFAVGCCGLFVSGWLEDDLSQYFGLLTPLLLIAVPFQVIGLLITRPSLRISKDNIKSVLYLRLKPQAKNKKELTAAGLIQIGQYAQLALYAYTINISSGDILEYPIMALNYLWLPTYIYLYQDLFSNVQTHNNHSLASSLSSHTARRFLGRHAINQSTWAATVGLRTPSFLINHDPGGAVARALPASLQQIRDREIQNCVSDLLGPSNLYNRVIGSQVFGTIDPESSIRPCVDVLSLCSCLYLDAIPLVERRLRGLARLLPILDPKLSAIFKPDDIDRLSTRNLWLFHFDFNWADQTIVKTERGTRYGVQMNDLPSTVKTSVYEYLRKRNQLGNFVWIGEKARERLMQEAPMIQSVIQAWPVPNEDGSEEFLVFLIKFEELIPKLQRYYNLDSKRKVLKDFEPTEESRRFINIVSLRLNNCQTLHEVIEVLEAIMSYPWRGFKEKDMALRATSQTYSAALETIAKQGVPADRREQVTDELRARFVKAVFAIGYPSQLVHIAQRDKMAFRNSQQIMRNASDPWHPRFEESWLLLATADPDGYSRNEVLEFLEFLKTVPDVISLHNKIIVVCKAMEAFANLSKRVKNDPKSLQTAILNRYAQWITALQAPTDICCLFLDLKLYLESHLEKDDILTDNNIKILSTYFDSLVKHYGNNSPEITAILDRWYRDEPSETLAS